MKTAQYFIDKGIVKKSDNKSLELFAAACDDFTKYKDLKPTAFVKLVWDEYQKNGNGNNNSNGKVFEFILAAILINKGIKPFYMQAHVAFVPGIDYDILLYSKENGPIVLSAKTSLRERFKQADLEAFALRNVHRTAQSYLLTLDETEAKRRIKNKNTLIGLDDIYYCQDERFNELIDCLTKLTFIEPKPIPIIASNIVIK